MFKKAPKIEADREGVKQNEIDEMLRIFNERFDAREKACIHREKAIDSARFDINHMLDLMTDLGYPAVAERMRTRLKASGVL